MPHINDYKCRSCGFSLPSGWGHYLYVVDAEGKRIECPHPGEFEFMEEITGYYPFKPGAAEHLNFGYHSCCLCVLCMSQFELDVDKDEHKCPNCGSSEIYTELEMVGKKCPVCRKGIIEEIYTGVIS